MLFYGHRVTMFVLSSCDFDRHIVMLSPMRCRLTCTFNTTRTHAPLTRLMRCSSCTWEQCSFYRFVISTRHVGMLSPMRCIVTCTFNTSHPTRTHASLTRLMRCSTDTNGHNRDAIIMVWVRQTHHCGIIMLSSSCAKLKLCVRQTHHGVS
jgi:hypothetical protein